jgi:acetate kinase
VISAQRPELPQIGCFDTTFHAGLPASSRRFAIPRELHDSGVRRYGFHGLSFAFIADRLQAMSPSRGGARTVVAHLGSGASLCAMRDGVSIDTTMGLTPLDGLMMGTRSGAIDPGVLLYLQRARHMSADSLEDMLYRESGLLGVSGLSADMRVLLASDDPRAAEAVDLFVVRAAKEIAAMAVSLGGLECLVFTGGIGQHAAEIRRRICELLRWLGIDVDASANAETRPTVSTAASRVEVLVIATSEETMIARHCQYLLPR